MIYEKELTQDDVNKKLWEAADASRTNLDAGVYKDYVLVMLFYKYLSDLNKQEYAKHQKRCGDDKARLESKMKLSRFYLPKETSFEELYKQVETDNIGEELNTAFEKIEEHNPDKLKGLLSSLDFNDENRLGKLQSRSKMLRDLMKSFAKLDLTRIDDEVIGNSYMYLIEKFGSDAGKKAGEFFTVKSVAHLLARLAWPKKGQRICDPAMGSGGLLLMTGEEIEKQYGSKDYSLYGQESTGSTFQLARMNMYLHRQDSAHLEWGDTLNAPLLVEDDKLMLFDICVANPPFSLKKWGADKAENDPYKRFYRGIPPKDKGDFAFITHMIETVKPKTGRVAVIVPHGVLFRGSSEGKIRQALLQENIIDTVIGLPAGLFQTTGIPVAILIIDRSREKGGSNENKKDILFIEASKEFVAGKAQNTLSQENADKIFDTYKQRKEIAKFSRLVSPEEIKENDYNLNITRYVDTFEEEEEIDIQANLKELAELNPQIQQLEKQMAKHLRQLKVDRK